MEFSYGNLCQSEGRSSVLTDTANMSLQLSRSIRARRQHIFAAVGGHSQDAQMGTGRQAAAMSLSVHLRSSNQNVIVMCAAAKQSASHAAEICKADSSKQHTSLHVEKQSSAHVFF